MGCSRTGRVVVRNVGAEVEALQRQDQPCGSNEPGPASSISSTKE